MRYAIEIVDDTTIRIVDENSKPIKVTSYIGKLIEGLLIEKHNKFGICRYSPYTVITGLTREKALMLYEVLNPLGFYLIVATPEAWAPITRAEVEVCHQG